MNWCWMLFARLPHCLHLREPAPNSPHSHEKETTAEAIGART
jgi:hypothetical protein